MAAIRAAGPLKMVRCGFSIPAIAGEGDIRIPAQRFGTLQADGTIKEEIIIADHPAGIAGHFRDPYLFLAGTPVYRNRCSARSRSQGDRAYL